MPSPETQLRKAGVSAEDIEMVRRAITRTMNAVFEDYGVPIDDPESTSQTFQTTIFQTVIDHGTNLNDSTISEQFDLLLADFEDPSSTSAITSIVFAAGVIYPSRREGDAVEALSKRIVARNYEHASD